ncbi:MAG TPA: amidohydrolase family protein [Vicinamibacterales bacterium]|nr:amidohydrolase family protein [Vicinamibacterales bacterium]
MRAFFVAAALLAVAGAPAGVQAPDNRGADLVRSAVITGATLIDPTAAPVADAVIVIGGSRITQVGTAASVKPPAGADVIDARGKFVIPGLADMHNHLGAGGMSLGPQRENYVGNLGRLLAVGVTTVFDPGVGESDFASLKSAAAADAAPYARFFGTGPAITIPGGSLGEQGPAPTTVEDARAVVQKLKAANVDAIKIHRDDLAWASKRTMQPMALDVLQALVDETHRLGLRAYVHAPQLLRAKEALRAGVDGLMHGIVDEPIDQEFIALMQKNRAVYVPTLGMFEDVADVGAFGKRQAPYWDQLGLQPPGIYQFLTSPQGVQIFQSFLSNTAFTKEHLPILRGNLQRTFAAGIPIVMGSDTGFFGVLLGVATPLEMELMVEAGLTPAQAIGAATINAARMIGRDKEQGSVEAGKLADLLILDANPLDDIGAIRRLHRVVKGGVVHDPAKLPR